MQIRKRITALFLVAFFVIVSISPVYASENIDFPKYIAELETSPYESDREETFLRIGEIHNKSSMSSMGELAIYSSDESIVAVDGLSLKGVNPGRAYIAYFLDGEFLYLKIYVVENEQYTVADKIDALPEGLVAIFPVLLCVLAVVILLLVVIIILVKVSRAFQKQLQQRKPLPPMQITDDTIRATPASCPQCGAVFEDAAFCGLCGTPLLAHGNYKFNIPDATYMQEFEDLANQWFAKNPYIYNCVLAVDMYTQMNALDPRRACRVSQATIAYDTSLELQKMRYGIACVYKSSFRKYTREQIMDDWASKNPDSVVIDACVAYRSHSSSISTAESFAFVLYQVPSEMKH